MTLGLLLHRFPKSLCRLCFRPIGMPLTPSYPHTYIHSLLPAPHALRMSRSRISRHTLRYRAFAQCLVSIRRCHWARYWAVVITCVVKRAIVDNFCENFVDVDIGARTLAVDEWMIRRENQSMYWQPGQQPIDAFQASTRILGLRRILQSYTCTTRSRCLAWMHECTFPMPPPWCASRN